MTLESKHLHTTTSALIFEVLLFIFPQIIVLRLAHVYRMSFSAESTTNLSPLTFYTLFIVTFILLSWGMYRFSKSEYSGLVYKLFFYIALFQGLLISSSLVTHGWLRYVLVLGLLFFYALNYTVLYHNLLLVPVLAGVGAIITSLFSLQSGIALLVFLTIYDFIAVYKTKHMVGFFKNMVQKDVFFAYIIPPRKQEWLYSLSFVEEGRVRYMFLGTGDVIAPMLITVPLSLINMNAVWYVLAGATLAVIGMFYIIRSSQKQRALAGIPFLSAGMLLGYLAYIIMS